MRLVVDANILIGELLRKRGLELVASTHLELYLAALERVGVCVFLQSA